ncbi:hypothetical protein ACHAPT_004658 [Fusarium lateritium]
MSLYPQDEPTEHLPADELYDATPPRSSAQRPVAPPPKRSRPSRENAKHHQDPAPPQTKKTKGGLNPSSKASRSNLAKYIENTDLVNVEEVSIPPPEGPKPRETRPKGNKTSTVQTKRPPQNKPDDPQAQGDPASEQGPKGKKRKQRAKTPIQFDNDTQAIKEVPNPKKSAAPVKMTRVNAMIQSSIASISPATSARKKTPPRAAQKAASKSTRKPVSKPVTRRAPPRKKPKTSVEEEHEDDSFIIANTTDVTEPKPAINTRARAAIQSKTKGARGQQGPEVNTDSQGLPQDPIVVSSDAASSAISEDESKPTEQSRPSQEIRTATQNSMAGKDAEPVVVSGPPPGGDRDEQGAVLPLEPVVFQPCRPLKVKEAIVDAMEMNGAESTEPAEKPINASSKRSCETHANPPQALSHRDPNIIVQGAPRNARGADLRSSDLQQEYISGLAAAESNHDKDRIALKAHPQKEKREQERDLFPVLTAFNRNLQNQIFESLRGQDEASVDEEKQAKTTDKGKEVAEQTDSERPTNEVAENLHALVETMLSHLATKEATVYYGADAYRKNGIDCVDKIERKYSQERSALADVCKKDGDRFARRVREARDAVEDGGKARDEALHQLEQAASKRRQLYQDASTGLRALHGRLLKRKRVEDEDD